jgi:hypothetical protein
MTTEMRGAVVGGPESVGDVGDMQLLYSAYSLSA